MASYTRIDSNGLAWAKDPKLAVWTRKTSNRVMVISSRKPLAEPYRLEIQAAGFVIFDETFSTFDAAAGMAKSLVRG